MLLRHTPETSAPRSAITINPAKACQPLGATIAALGIHGCLPHSHGSQGCASYHRSTLSRHYKEPVLASTSSFTEGTSVFGGQGNLLQAIRNIFSVYDPEVIAVHTTCLSETIGDDLVQILATARNEGLIPEGKAVLHANTPSYAGSHVTGFATMTQAMATQLAEPDQERQPDQINVIPGWVEPSDMRALKELLAHFGVRPIMFPDLTDVTDSVPSGDHSMYPPGGVTVADLRRTGASALTLALGPTASQAAGRSLKTEHGVPLEVLELPIGLRATDAVVQQLHRFSGVPVPDAITYERARLIDMLKNMNSYLYRKRVAVTGDPDQLVSLCQFVSDAGMQPVYAVTGTPGKGVVKRIQNALGEKAGEVRIAHGAQADLFQLHQWIKQEPVDLIIGNSYCKYIARDEGIPLVRASFPIFDRVGHQYFPLFGYRGGLRLIDMILEAFQGRLDAESPEESFELVM